MGFVYFWTTPLIGGLLSLADSLHKIYKLTHSFKNDQFEQTLVHQAQLRRAYHEFYIASASYPPLPILFSLMCAKPEYFNLTAFKDLLGFDGYSKEGLGDALDFISQHTGVENVDAVMLITFFSFLYFWLVRSLGNYISSKNLLNFIAEEYDYHYSSTPGYMDTTDENIDGDDMPPPSGKTNGTTAKKPPKESPLFQQEVNALEENLKQMSALCPNRKTFMFTVFGLKPNWHGRSTNSNERMTNYWEHIKYQDMEGVQKAQETENIKNLSKLR